MQITAALFFSPQPQMLWTTTPNFEHRTITDYCGVVVAEIALTGGSLGTSIEVGEGLNLDLTFQTSRFEEARTKALRNLEDQVRALRADAVIGLRFEYVTFGKNGVLNMVSAYGTAVRLKFSAEGIKRQQMQEMRETANFWVSIEGKERGPFSVQQLAQLAADGKLRPDAPVRSEGSNQVVNLERLLSDDS